MARCTQLCALYRHFCHSSQGKHDDNGKGTSWLETRASLRRHVVGVGVRMRGGTVGPHCHIAVRGERWRIVLIMSLSCRHRAGGRGRIDVIVRERVMAKVRVCCCRQGEGDGDDGEGMLSALSSLERGSRRGSACHHQREGEGLAHRCHC